MSNHSKSCNICDDRHITKQATHWCSECEQAFCNECKEYHAYSRLSKNHTTISMSDFLSLEPSFSSITSVCAEHNDIYQIFCRTHDKLLCHNCLANHDGCKGIVPLTEITKTVKSSSNFQETQHGLTDIHENITKIQDAFLLSLKSIKEEELILLSEIGTTRKKIDDHLDKLEHDLRKKVSEEAAKSRAAIEVLLQKLDDRKSEITNHLQQMKYLETYASNFQTYLSLRHLSSAVDSAELFVNSMANDGSLEINTLILNFDKKIKIIVSNIQQFGIVQVQKKTFSVPLIRQKDKQAQLVGLGRPHVKSINDIKLRLFKTIETTCRAIRGCEILPNENMLFSNYTLTGRVLVFDSNGKRLFDDLMKPDRPCLDITGMGDNSKVAITCGFVHGIEIVDISKSKLKLQKRIPTKNGCFGVAFNDDSLFCCIHKEGIQKINLDNYSLSPIVKFDLTFGYIAVNNNKIYYTDRDKNTVTCYDMQGQLLWKCKDDTYLKAPCNISVDNNEFVYVVSEEKNSITVLSPDGQDKRMLLTNSEGENLPRALHFDRLRNRLLVAFEEATTFLFDVSV